MDKRIGWMLAASLVAGGLLLGASDAMKSGT